MRIVITVRGGQVTGVFSETFGGEALECAVVDYDNSESVVNGKRCSVSSELPDADPDFVVEAFATLEGDDAWEFLDD